MNQQQAARFQSRVKDCMVAFRPALVPLFTQRRKRPELVGTAVAVGTKPERLLLTAAHVIREFDGDTIITPSGADGLRLRDRRSRLQQQVTSPKTTIASMPVRLS